jgi:hypothetical protein
MWWWKRKTKNMLQLPIASHETWRVDGRLNDGTPDVDAFDRADEQDDFGVVVLVLLVECDAANYHEQTEQTQQAQAPKHQSQIFCSERISAPDCYISLPNHFLVCTT